MRYILNDKFVDIEDLIMALYDKDKDKYSEYNYIRLVEIDTDKKIMVFENYYQY